MKERPGKRGRHTSGPMNHTHKLRDGGIKVYVGGVYLGVTEKRNVSQYSCTFPSQYENSEWECYVLPTGWVQAFCSSVTLMVLCCVPMRHSEIIVEWMNGILQTLALWLHCSHDGL